MNDQRKVVFDQRRELMDGDDRRAATRPSAAGASACVPTVSAIR
jgi:preprotein translocase subunit SecA